MSFLKILWISVVSVLISLLFLILFIWVLSLIFLISLIKGLSNFFIFLRNQLLVSLISFVWLFRLFCLFLLWSLLFLLLFLGYVCCYFSNLFSYKVILFIWAFFQFLEVGLYCYEISSVLHWFWLFVFLFSFVWRYLLISSLIWLLTQSLFSNMLLNLNMFVFFRFFSYNCFLLSYLVVREDAWNNFNFLKFIESCFMA